MDNACRGTHPLEGWRTCAECQKIVDERWKRFQRRRGFGGDAVTAETLRVDPAQLLNIAELNAAYQAALMGDNAPTGAYITYFRGRPIRGRV